MMPLGYYPSSFSGYNVPDCYASLLVLMPMEMLPVQLMLLGMMIRVLLDTSERLARPEKGEDAFPSLIYHLGP